MTFIQRHKFGEAAMNNFVHHELIRKQVSVSPSEGGAGESMVRWHQQPQSVTSVKEGKHGELHIRARPNV